MLDLDRETMNKFYKTAFSDANEVTRVSKNHYCLGRSQQFLVKFI